MKTRGAIWTALLAGMVALAVILSWRAGFEQGQLKASLGIHYYWYDANGDVVHDPSLTLHPANRLWRP